MSSILDKTTDGTTALKRTSDGITIETIEDGAVETTDGIIVMVEATAGIAMMNPLIGLNHCQEMSA